MAAYKAEFMSHYYEQHRRPRQAWSMGRIGEWAPLAAAVPRLANFFSPYVRGIAGVARQRSLPRFAAQTFRAQFRSGGGGKPVVLFDDTFNNHFRPQTAAAAQRVLEKAGCTVELPGEHVCCGRPYYDFGMLARARKSLTRVLEVLAPQLERGVPIVVLEPGCLSVFRDEMAKLLPGDARAARLAAKATSLAEHLLESGADLPPAGGRVLMHGHCHQKALWGAGADLAVLQRCGVKAAAPDTGCCGMAGSFGYRPEFYETSVRIAELALLPALRADPEAPILANGFSCREQIEGLAQRPTLHLAELLARA
jgi:Fe-S oxidoreductase